MFSLITGGEILHKNMQLNRELMMVNYKFDISKLLNKLAATYTDAGCALDYNDEFQLLCAVMLSAQTTDVSVNKVTPYLFEAYRDPKRLSAARQSDVEKIISSLGLYKNKAKNLIAMSKVIHERYADNVPNDFNALVELPGVGRKTANVVLAEVFHEQRIAVDTHVFRVSNRIGIANAENVVDTEKQLMKVIPQNRWIESHHLLIFHGRRCCKARKPNCAGCPVLDMCCNPVLILEKE